VFLLFILTLLLSGCAGAQSALDPAGPQAWHISRLWWLMFWGCLLVYLLVMVALALALRRARRQAAPQAEPAHERKLTKTVALAVGVSIIILFIFLIADLMTGRAVFSYSSPDAVQINVTGYQWWWDFEYDDPVPNQRVRTANELHLPVGRPVKLVLTSRDVIHSFWVPNLHGKTDLLTGHQTVTWLKADRPGVYRGQCAEYCGHQHAHMALLVVAEAPEQFDAWLTQQRQPAVTPATPEQQRGQQLFLTRTCVMCHTIRGTEAGARTAPELTHLAARQTIAAGTLPNNHGNLGGWVLDSQRIKPGNRMPPQSLSSDELQALLSYLESLK
jgi:cytochrome c oxidase subunit II